VEKLRTEMAKKSGRSEIMEWLVFGVAGLVLLGFFGAVVAYFQGRPIGSPIRINTEGAK